LLPGSFSADAMSIISKYLTKSLLYPVISVVTILSVIILVTQSLKYIDLVATHGINIEDFIQISFFLIPSLLFIIMPICLFIAIIYGLNKLNSHRELGIFSGVGLDNLQIAKPAIKIAVCAAILHYCISLYLMPIINNKFKNLTADLKSNYVSLFLQEKVFNHPTQYITFYINKKLGANQFEQILYQDERGENPVTIIAKRANLMQQGNKIYLKLENGSRQSFNNKKEFSVLYFDDLLLQIDFSKNSYFSRPRTIQEKHIIELIFPTDNPENKIRTKMLAEAEHRLIWPLYNIILTIIAINIFLKGEYKRSGKTYRIFLFSSMAAFIVIIHHGLINLSAQHWQLIIFDITFTILLLYGLYYASFKRD
jgi:lipopolysaccharide export system permease protein